MPTEWLVLGLGNPGRRYQRTRHNAGARAAERLAARLGGRLKKSRWQALSFSAAVGDHPVHVARPATFMNQSGNAAAEMLRKLNVRTDQLVVLHDEIDIPAFSLRIKMGGGTAGHRGVASVAERVRTKDFFRVRIGVGRPEGSRDPADWVLDKMSKGEMAEAEVTEEQAAEAALVLIDEGLDSAMSRFNSRRS